MLAQNQQHILVGGAARDCGVELSLQNLMGSQFAPRDEVQQNDQIDARLLLILPVFPLPLDPFPDLLPKSWAQQTLPMHQNLPPGRGPNE